jgi:hypothetical protein
MARYIAVFVLVLLGVCGKVAADIIVYNFDAAPLHSPLPLDQTVAGVTAHIASATAIYNYSVQQANAPGSTPAGFAGSCISPNTINQSDLAISFSQLVNSASILYAPDELATDSSCTMRITGYLGATYVGTNTHTISPPGTWPSGTLSLVSVQPFDNVVIHYDHAPVTGGDYGPIFMADNLTIATVPEPGSLLTLALGGAMTAAAILIRRRRSLRGQHKQLAD